MGCGIRALQRERGRKQRAALRGPSLSRTLKKAAPEGASGQHRQRKEERRAQPENSLRRGRAECVARSPPAVAGASLGNLWNGPR